MKLPAVLDVKPIMVLGNLDSVEKRLEVCVAVGRVKQLLKRNIFELGKSDEAVDEESNVVVARFLG
jgi:hypothetical protein